MKKIFLPLTIIILFFASQNVNAQGIFDKVKNKVKQRADQKVDNAIDKGIDKADPETNGTMTKDKTKEKTKDKSQDDQNDNNSDKNNNTVSAAPSLKVYQNYDFVPGDKILFEDDFVDDQDGEFPSHWELKAGQAIINKLKGTPAFYLTEGNYAVVRPRTKTPKYLTEPFTIEYDYYHVPGAYGLVSQLQYISKDCGDCETNADILVNEHEVSFGGQNVSLSKSYPEAIAGENFSNKWHHVAMAFKNHQLKVYVDQNRILVVPDTKSDFYAVQFAGIGEEKNPIVFKNVRIASGGDMNMIGKKFTETKIVTHGINFDIDKASIKPESMGTLNMIVQVMKDNPDIKFEVDGHTDNTGSAQHNLSLSQQRADAVRTQLVNMGIDPSRLTSKGFGDTKPISDNSTFDGRANNRRVEFVKM